MTYGIIAALPEEQELLAKRMYITRQDEVYGTTILVGLIEGRDVVLCRCGIGKLNAALCTALLIREYGAQAIINIGIAGAVGKGVRALDLVISSDAVCHDVQHEIYQKYYPFKVAYEADKTLVSRAVKAAEELGDITCHVGRIATGDWFIADRVKKQEIVEQFHPLAVEMEGGAVAYAAYLNHCPFVIIRTMSDCADEEADESYDNLIERAAHLSASIALKMVTEERTDR